MQVSNRPINIGLTRTMIVQARQVASEFGGERSEKRQTIERALAALEEVLQMIEKRAGRSMDKQILRAGMAILGKMDEANLPGEIEEIIASPTPSTVPLYRLSIPDLSDDEDTNDNVEALQIVGTQQQLETLLRFIHVPADFFAPPADEEEAL